MSERRGNWSQTFTGRQFWPLDPRPEDIDVRDIAHALALQCRFAGHCRVPYSVAEHSVRVADWLLSKTGDDSIAFAGLLHDASEAYCADEVLLMTEARDLMGPSPAPWTFAQGVAAEPLTEIIVPWGWETAERVFLARFEALRAVSR